LVRCGVLLLVGMVASLFAAAADPSVARGESLSTVDPSIAVTVGPLGERALDPAVVETVMYAILAIFCLEGGRTGVEYFYRGGYREHSSQTAIQPILVRCGVLLLVGMVASLFAAAADPSVARGESLSTVDPSIAGTALVGSIVLVKLGFDLGGIYSDRISGFGSSPEDAEGVAIEGVPEDIDANPATDRRVRPWIGRRLLATRAHWFRSGAAWKLGGFLACFGFLFAVGGAWWIAAGILVFASSLTVFLVHLDYWLRYGSVEYLVDGDSLLAYDRLFDDPLWRIEAWDESDVRVEHDWVDRRLGTTTVVVDLPDRTVRLPRLRNPAPIIAVFDRPVDGLTVE